MKKVFVGVLLFLLAFATPALPIQDEMGSWNCKGSGKNIVCHVVENYSDNGKLVRENLTETRAYLITDILYRVTAESFEKGYLYQYINLHFNDGFVYRIRIYDVYGCAQMSDTFDSSRDCILICLEINKLA